MDALSLARGPWVPIVAVLCALVGAGVIRARSGRAIDDIEPPDVVARALPEDAPPLRVEGPSGAPSDAAELPGIEPPSDLSIGRLAGDGPTGVVVHDAARMAPGRTLLVSAHAPEAVLVEPDGTVHHTWRAPFDAVFPGWSGKPDPGMRHLGRAVAVGGGDLVATFEGIGIFRLGPDSDVRWRVANGASHGIELVGRRAIWHQARKAHLLRSLNDEAAVWEELLVTLDGDGHEKRRANLLVASRETPFQERIRALLAAGGDALHASDLVRLGDGDVVVALREADLLAVLSFPQTKIAALRPGHGHPRAIEVLPDGHLLLLVDDGIVELDGENRVWHWAGDLSDDGPCGSLQALENGNVLVTDPPTGRALEVTREGDVVWEWRSPHRAPSAPDHVATLLQATRVPE